jgi:antirestriction protein ArdC
VKNTVFGSPDYAREELIAEMGAAFLCGHRGIERATIENSDAYVAGWLRRLRQDPKLVVRAAGKAQKAADCILGEARETAAETAEAAAA